MAIHVDPQLKAPNLITSPLDNLDVPGIHPHVCTGWCVLWQTHGHHGPNPHMFIHPSASQGLVTKLVDSVKLSCREPLLIFTAGAMGVGKTHVIRWMKEEGILPLDDFVPWPKFSGKCLSQEWHT